MCRHSLFAVRFCLIAVAGQGALIVAQPRDPVYLWQPMGIGIGYYERSENQVRLAIVEPLGGPSSSVRSSRDGTPVSILVQSVRVLSSNVGEPVSLRCVTAEQSGRNAAVASKMKVGSRYLIAYFVPNEGRCLINTEASLQLNADEVGGAFALQTRASVLSPGTSFEEVLFASYIEALGTMDVSVMTELAGMCPPPPGMQLRGRGARSTRSMTDLLRTVSQRLSLQGGLIDVMFHARLAAWQIEGSAEPLLRAVLAHTSDPRIETILAWQHLGLVGDGKPSQFDSAEAQERLLNAASSTVSDAAAALLVLSVSDPMSPDQRARFLALLNRDMPRLRAQVCNTLASHLGRPERMLPFTKDKDGWEQRVAEMSQTWLTELGG